MKTAARLSAAALAAAVAFASPASAQITFTGFSNGCFGIACVPATTNANATSTIGPLIFRNSTFTGNTTGGFLAIGSQPSTTMNVDNLGSFLLNSGSQNFAGGQFNLRVSFTAPAGTAPANQVFTANLLGQVLTGASDNGGVTIMFTNPTQQFSFDGGTFTLTVNNVSLQGVAQGGDPRLVSLSGFINATVVPEPSTYLLMGSGLLGLGVMYRRRRAV